VSAFITDICLLGVNGANFVSPCHKKNKVIFYDWASRLYYIQCGHFIVSLNRFSVVSIFSRLHAERSGVQFPALIRDFFVAETSGWCLWSTQPLIKSLPQGFFLGGLKRLGCEADYSPPSGAEVIVSPDCLRGVNKDSLAVFPSP